MLSINLDFEKTLHLTTQERYDIMNFATVAAEDDGFMNSFIFERALYVFAAIYLFEDRHDEITELAANNMNTAWQTLLEDGTIDDLVGQYATDLDVLAQEGSVWYQEYTEYAHSARGLLNTVQTLSGDIVRNAAEQLKSASTDDGVQQILQAAESWGMNNSIPSDSLLEN